MAGQLLVKASDGVFPDGEQVKDELLVVWDGYSPLSIGALHVAYEEKRTLEDVGVDEREARACVGKYNSLIFRGPGKGPLVSPGEAEKWMGKTMSAIVEIVTERAQAPE